MAGYLAYSMAGHDKGQLYVVLSEEKDCVWLADGDTRTMDNPKKKNRKHVQPLKQTLPDGAVTNEVIKRTIKLYGKDMQEVK